MKGNLFCCEENGKKTFVFAKQEVLFDFSFFETIDFGLKVFTVLAGGIRMVSGVI